MKITSGWFLFEVLSRFARRKSVLFQVKKAECPKLHVGSGQSSFSPFEHQLGFKNILCMFLKNLDGHSTSPPHPLGSWMWVPCCSWGLRWAPVLNKHYNPRCSWTSMSLHLSHTNKNNSRTFKGREGLIGSRKGCIWQQQHPPNISLLPRFDLPMI